MPVLEAAACGLPLVITSGGATDDFTDASFARRVSARRMPPPYDGAHPVHPVLVARGDYLEPDHDDLVTQLLFAASDAEWRAEAGAAAASWVLDKNLTWRAIAEAHLRSLFGSIPASTFLFASA